MQILLLEDDFLLSEIMEVAITSARRDVKLHKFINSSKAYDYILEHISEIDLFILDVRVPGHYTGLELGEEIRKLDANANIIVSSAYQRPASKEQMKQLNIEWQPKPWHVFEIQEKVAAFIVSQ